MDIKIHRGLEQIGGCITEISTATSRVFIDMGQNLPGIGEVTTADEDRQMVEDLFSQNRKEHEAVFYTHTHEDHIGLFRYVPEGVPQYIGEGAKEIMVAKNESIIEAIMKVNKAVRFMLKTDDNAEQDATAEQAETSMPNHNAMLQRLKGFNTWKRPKPHTAPRPIEVGNIRVTPFFCSHSAYDCYMLLIEADGKRIWHTGDYREHGYLGKGLMPTIKHYATDIDVLITEGTMLGRTDQCIHEREVARRMALAMEAFKYVVVLASSTDIERLASIKQAARLAKRDYYISNRFMRKTMSIFTRREASNSKGLFDFHPKFMRSNDGSATMRKRGFVFIATAAQLGAVQYICDGLDPTEVLLIYSAWDGYYKDPEQVKANPRYKFFREAFDNVVDIHTSGHADRETLAKVITAINPRESIIGIHKDPDTSLKSLDIPEALKAKVKECDNSCYSERESLFLQL